MPLSTGCRFPDISERLGVLENDQRVRLFVEMGVLSDEGYDFMDRVFNHFDHDLDGVSTIRYCGPRNKSDKRQLHET